MLVLHVKTFCYTNEQKFTENDWNKENEEKHSKTTKFSFFSTHDCCKMSKRGPSVPSSQQRCKSSRTHAPNPRYLSEDEDGLASGEELDELSDSSSSSDSDTESNDVNNTSASSGAMPQQQRRRNKKSNSNNNEEDRQWEQFLEEEQFVMQSNAINPHPTFELGNQCVDESDSGAQYVPEDLSLQKAFTVFFADIICHICDKTNERLVDKQMKLHNSP